MMKSGFFDKLIERLDKLYPSSLQTHFLRLARESGMLEAIFQSIQEGIIVVDGLGRLVYANRASEQMIGFSYESARGRPVMRYLRDIDWDRILKFEAGEWSKLINTEVEITYPEHRFLKFYIVPLASGKPAGDELEKGAVLILRNVTEEHMSEAEVLETERLNAVKLLAAGVAHEIGNPLNALNIHLQLLSREVQHSPETQQAKLKDLVDVARDEVSRLDMIITQFLRALRPSKPKFALSQVDAVLKETLNLLKQEIKNKDIRIEIDIAEAVPKLYMDRNLMKQAFFNIIRNAFQAMQNGGLLRVTMSTTNDYLRIAFRDNGAGIKPSDLGRVFEPYHSTKKEGSGLGLMIVQRIVQDHGGEIELDSKPGTGTTFAVNLPLAERRVKLLKAHRTRRTSEQREQEAS